MIRLRKKKTTIFIFIAPAIIPFLAFFCYPVLRTFLMSFFDVEQISSKIVTWKFVGLDNYFTLKATSFPNSLMMLFKVWLCCGIVVFILSLLFATMLTSGVYGKGFFRSMLYLTNVIPQIALGYMWTLYVFSSRFGMLKKLFNSVGLEKAASFAWTSPDNMFISMCIAYVFSCTGYFMLQYMAAIEAIPKSLYEAAEIDGATKFSQFLNITFPLIRNTLVTSLTLWTSRVCAFFALSRVFISSKTVSPLMYIYNVLFGTDSSNTAVGVGAAAAVIVALIVVAVFMISNLIPKNKDIEL